MELIESARVTLNATLARAQQWHRTRTGKAREHVPMGVLGKHEANELRRFYARFVAQPRRPDWAGRLTPEFQKQWCEVLEHFGASGGPANGNDDQALSREYQRIWEAATEGRFSIDQLQRLIHAEGPKYAKTSPFYTILFRTPGYAGSAELIELMHNQMGLGTTSPITPWHGYLRFCNDSHSSRAVRDRATVVAAIAEKESHRHLPHHPFKVASYAGGTGRFATALLESVGNEHRELIHIYLYDVDPRAALFAQRRIKELGFSAQCTSRCCNLLSNQAFNVSAPGLSNAYHFAECSGLFDYLPATLSEADRSKGRTVPAFGFMLKKMFDTIAPGGLLVIGNFAKGHPNRAFMELGNWSLLLRDEAELEDLARRYSGFLAHRGDSIDFARVAPNTTQILMLLRKGET
jgi:hypothetical protein